MHNRRHLILSVLPPGRWQGALLTTDQSSSLSGRVAAQSMRRGSLSLPGPRRAHKPASSTSIRMDPLRRAHAGHECTMLTPRTIGSADRDFRSGLLNWSRVGGASLPVPVPA